MQIETYECEELKNSDATTMAVDAEAIELIEKLGLEGQKKLTNPETLTRYPYRDMTVMEKFVWQSVCPEVTYVESYKLSPMPLRILQVIAYARDLGIYEKLEVWHPNSIKDDPCLVGVPKGEKYGQRRQLLARWGEHLMTFEQAKEKAKVVYSANLVDKLRTIKSQVDLLLTNPDSKINLAFETEKFDLPEAYHLS